MSESLSFKSLGRCEYGETLHMMKSHISNEGFKNEIWFLEHPPIFTLGTAADQKHILNAGDIPIFQSDRGGEVTYHGPGQLVIYFLLDIKKSSLGPKTLVKTLQEFTKSLLENFIHSQILSRYLKSTIMCKSSVSRQISIEHFHSFPNPFEIFEIHHNVQILRKSPNLY